MSDLKISQLPAAASLTGAELIELVQAGVNVQTNVSAISGTLFSIQGNPNGSVNASLANQLIWNNLFPQTSGSPTGIANTGAGGAWTIGTGTATFQSLNGGGANLGASVQMGIITSAAVANSAAEMANSGTFVPGNPAAIALCRVTSNGLAVGGFTLTLYFSFTTTIASEQVFMGFSPGSGGLGGSQVPSALLNMVGLGKDAADTSLQFMINNGAGSAQKTSLGAGVTLASLTGHLLRLVITADGAGNCAITLTDLEAGGASYSITYPTATAKLPAAFAGTGGQLTPHLHINNGGTASAVAFGYMAGFITAGFGAC